jgi:hypothetical protein
MTQTFHGDPAQDMAGKQANPETLFLDEMTTSIDLENTARSMKGSNRGSFLHRTSVTRDSRDRIEHARSRSKRKNPAALTASMRRTRPRSTR